MPVSVEISRDLAQMEEHLELLRKDLQRLMDAVADQKRKD